MARLNDTQTLLLAHAAKRDSGSFYPLPETCSGGTARATKAIAALLKLGLALEREVGDATLVARTDGDLRYGVFTTDAGLAAINITPGNAAAVASTPPPPRTTKVSMVLALLGRTEGATQAELVAATGWLPHTMRAALTGLRKKGHVIERGKRDDVTRYHIAVTA